MRRTTLIAAAIATIAALVVAPTGAATTHGNVTTLSCTLQLYAQGAPNPSAFQFGFVHCPEPFGSGLHYDEYTATPTGPGTGTIAGTFTNYYDRGTTHGTVAMTFVATPPNITYDGTVTYTGGTGKFKHVEGGGTIHCTTTDAGTHKSCAVDSTLTGV